MQYRKLPFLTVAIVCLLTAGGWLFAQENTLQVKITDEQGTALKDAQVRIQKIPGDFDDNDETSDDGVVEFDELVNGFYRVWVRTEGYEPQFTEFVHLEGGAREEVTFQLRPGDPNKQFYFEDESQMQAFQRHLQDGASAIQSQQLDVAEEYLLQAIAIKPSDPRAHFNLALIYMDQGRLDEARDELTRTLDELDIYLATEEAGNNYFSNMEQQAQELLGSLGTQRLAQEAHQAMQAKNYEEALVKLGELAEAQPEENNANVYYTMAVARSQLNQLDEAQALLQKAMELDPDQEAFPDLYNRIDELKAARKEAQQKNQVVNVQNLNAEERHEEAIQAANTALENLPEKFHQDLWAQIVTANLALENYDEAIAALREQFKYSDEAPDDHLFEIGQKLVGQGKLDAARKTFEAVLRVNPDYSEAYYELGMDAFYEQQDKERARELLEKYLELGQDQDHISNAKNVLAVMEHSSGN